MAFEEEPKFGKPSAEEKAESLEERINESKKEIFEGAGEHSPEVVFQKMENLEGLLRQEKKEGQGKLSDTIDKIKTSPEGNKYFVDGSVAYLPERGKAFFIGDIHGDAEAVASIVEQVEFIKKIESGERDNFLVFLGDYADRGEKDIAAIEEITNLKLRYPENVILLRGNHEDKDQGIRYGLRESLTTKYGQPEGERLFDKYNNMAKEMPGVVVTGNGILGVHGGIPNEEINSLKDLNNAQILEQMRWNDPTEETLERATSPRDRHEGYFKSFGEKAFGRFMGKIGGKVMIRSHEYPSEGWELNFNDKLATVFSNGSEKSPSSGYKDHVNQAMFARIDLEDSKEKFSPHDFDKVLYKKVEKESIPEEKKIESEEEKAKKVEEWYETFTKFGGTKGREKIKEAERELAEERKAVESAKIPEKGMEPEQISKEVGIEKPAESFGEIEERLKEKLKEARVRGGEKLSEAEEIERTRDFYLKELGYSLEYKGLLRGKARLLDAEGKYVVDGEGKAREFKAFFRLKKERTPLIDFLKEELKSKFEEKPEEVPAGKTEEEKLETGFQKAVEGAEKDQKRRVEKISSLQDVKKVGKERLSKLVEGLSYVAALDKLGILGMKKGKDIAIEGGKDLAAVGLTPAAVVEEGSRYITGRIQIGEALRKSVIMREKARLLEQVPSDKRPEYYNDLLETIVKAGSEKASEELIRGYDKIYKKGKILRLIEMLGGKLSRPIGRTFGPPRPPRPERI